MLPAVGIMAENSGPKNARPQYLDLVPKALIWEVGVVPGLGGSGF